MECLDFQDALCHRCKCSCKLLKWCKCLWQWCKCSWWVAKEECLIWCKCSVTRVDRWENKVKEETRTSITQEEITKDNRIQTETTDKISNNNKDKMLDKCLCNNQDIIRCNKGNINHNNNNHKNLKCLINKMYNNKHLKIECKCNSKWKLNSKWRWSNNNKCKCNNNSNNNKP